jgi:hypothetical protein
MLNSVLDFLDSLVVVGHFHVKIVINKKLINMITKGLQS